MGKSYIACCPAHDDKTPSLKITQADDGRILIRCFAGCEPQVILGMLGYTMSDLFQDKGLGDHFKGWTPKKPQRQRTDETILQIAENMRGRGERLSESELQEERDAWLRLSRTSTSHGL